MINKDNVIDFDSFKEFLLNHLSPLNFNFMRDVEITRIQNKYVINVTIPPSHDEVTELFFEEFSYIKPYESYSNNIIFVVDYKMDEFVKRLKRLELIDDVGVPKIQQLIGRFGVTI